MNGILERLSPEGRRAYCSMYLSSKVCGDSSPLAKSNSTKDIRNRYLSPIRLS